jgi:UDP-N-acetylglucosamine 2-epimerase (non-hydrolysing)
MTQTVLFVVGARPNFVKVAPVVHALAPRPEVDVVLLHTGQHYDRALSDAFLEQLELPPPRHNLGIGSGSHAEQTAAVMIGVERVLAEERPDAMVVAGDVNSTMASALSAVKLEVPVVHLESGLRSRDWSMPEEINRVVTDRVSDLLLCHSQEAVDNLAEEGIKGEPVALVGNTMIDTLFRLLPAAEATRAVERQGLEPGGFTLVTMHRPAVVDDPDALASVLEVLADLALELPVVFPLHPRTRDRLGAAPSAALDRLIVVPPLGYLEFVALEASARLVITDSGGVQEETSALGVPCLTYRRTTERWVTIELGTNRLVGTNPQSLAAAAAEELGRPPARPAQIPLWDGRAAPRAADALLGLLSGAIPRATRARPPRPVLETPA